MIEKKIGDQPTLPNIQIKNEQTPFVCPTQIGPYKIESLYKRGGMSILYLATHPKINRPILIKVLSPKFVKNREIMERFLKEAEIIQLSNHPNIIKLYGQGKWEEGLYIAMEFIQGVSLRQFIQQKSLSQKKALEIILQVAYALSHLHSHGVIHRDLKPENILITETGEIKVIDFGIAQLNKSSNNERITSVSRIMGTPVYMSPEQKEDPSIVSYPSDIFSLGIIIYELVLGRLSHGIIHLSLLPKGLRKIIDKALKIKIEERYQNIVDLITDISEYIRVHQDEKEKSEDEQFDEIFDAFARMQGLLLPKSSPNWPRLDIGIAAMEGSSLTSIYLDFLQLTENNYVVVLAEPQNSSIESFVYISILRGMIRMILDEVKKTKEIHPVRFLNSINHVLTKDPMHQNFTVSFLLLNFEQDQLSFASCGNNKLWHIPEDNQKLTNLTTPNLLLGKDANSAIVETSTNWNIGDRLILHTSKSLIQLKKQDALKQVISDNYLFSCKKQAEKIVNSLKKLSSNAQDETSAVVCIQRKL